MGFVGFLKASSKQFEKDEAAYTESHSLSAEGNEWLTEIQSGVGNVIVVIRVYLLIFIGVPDGVVGVDETHETGVYLEQTHDLYLLDEYGHGFGVGDVLIVGIQPELFHEQRQRNVKSKC